MKIYDTKINHLTNPLGFSLKRTVFSWKVREAAGKKQSSARILIASDAQMSRILTDTGFSPEADALGWNIPFPLQPCTRYFWTVTVRTDAGDETVSDVQWFETAKREQPWSAKWITCDSTEKRHPYFEKEITPRKTVSNARLYITGLGLYEVYYNDRRIGNEYLTPYSNNYNRWVQYQTYDMTEALQNAGKLSVLLGNGWYKARFGFSAHEDIGFYGSEWKLIAELQLTYDDGTSETIVTDESWTVRRSNITFSNLYDGEWMDTTLPALPEEKACCCESPKGRLKERMSLPVTVHETFSPVQLIHTPAGELVFDMGQEFTGLFRLKIREEKGTVVHIQTGEVLQEGNFYNANLRSAKSEYFFTCDGSEQIVMPHFTFYGYRYVKISGVTHLEVSDFKGLAIYSSFSETGWMETGHALLNRFISNVRWGLKSNFVDVPTDCPQRDERMGWTGDAQVFSPTATYLTDTYAFYAKYLYDMWQEQLTFDGMVPDVIPSCGVKTCACVWGDASCIIPWNLYLFYGDKSILEDQFDSMKAWVDYVRRLDGDSHAWRDHFHYGDWLALDNMNGDAEQTLGATDEAFIANLYYAVSAELTAKAAAVLGRTEEETIYRKLSDEQFAEVKREFYSVTGRCCIKTQTALLLTLKYHLSDNEAFVKEQLRKLFETNNNKLTTGFVGTPLMCNILSDNGMDDLAYNLLLNEEYPGWLNEVKLGATTVWERWNSLLSDGTVSGIGMNSMNHYSYGSVLEWMFRHAAGLNTLDTAPGVKEMEIAPVPNKHLGYMKAEYDSPSGLYECHWKLEDDSHVTISVTVPFGCTARLKLPKAKQWDESNPMTKAMLAPGTYRISYELAEPLACSFSLDSPLRELLASPEAMKILSKAIPVARIPNQFKGNSLREMAAKFGGQISEEALEQIDAALQSI